MANKEEGALSECIVCAPRLVAILGNCKAQFLFRSDRGILNNDKGRREPCKAMVKNDCRRNDQKMVRDRGKREQPQTFVYRARIWLLLGAASGPWTTTRRVCARAILMAGDPMSTTFTIETENGASISSFSALQSGLTYVANSSFSWVHFYFKTFSSFL